jgi:hypothetical protein
VRGRGRRGLGGGGGQWMRRRLGFVEWEGIRLRVAFLEPGLGPWCTPTKHFLELRYPRSPVKNFEIKTEKA